MPISFLTKNIKGLHTEKPMSKNIWSRVVYEVCHHRAKELGKKIRPYFIGKNILDIGFGHGTNALMIAREGFNVKGIDVVDMSMYEDFKATLYDGEHIPFYDKSFDTAIIIHVLHHCDNRMKVLKDALRVSKRVIVTEDTYRNWVEWFFVSINDMVGNFEFRFHPYYTKQEWRKIIKDNGWKLIADKEWSNIWKTAFPFYSRHYVFVIEG